MSTQAKASLIAQAATKVGDLAAEYRGFIAKLEEGSDPSIGWRGEGNAEFMASIAECCTDLKKTAQCLEIESQNLTDIAKTYNLGQNRIRDMVPTPQG